MMAALMFPVFSKAREKARTAGCLSHVKEISMGAAMYASDHDGVLPEAANWVALVSAYLPNKKVLWCPSAGNHDNTYAMNSKMSRIKVSGIKNPSDTVMIFDSIPGIYQNGGIERMPSPGRHLTAVSKYNYETQQKSGNNTHGESSISVNNIGFADGHVKSMTVDDAASLIWDPAKK
jgi:prepilin-type processing-associated H-X9-DG protein